jgi:Tfp pilus assembly protein PilE
MIVVVILGILAGIGVQQYANVQQRAKEAADEANRKVLTNATHMWLILGSAPTTAGNQTVTDEQLVPQYLEKWPDYPLDEKERYIVTVETAEDSTTGDLQQYSIKVETEPKESEENPG